jgi:hypothetical protein
MGRKEQMTQPAYAYACREVLFSLSGTTSMIIMMMKVQFEVEK